MWGRFESHVADDVAKTGPPEVLMNGGRIVLKMLVSAVFYNRSGEDGKIDIRATRQRLVLLCHNGGDRMYVLLPYRLVDHTPFENQSCARRGAILGKRLIRLVIQTE